MSEFAFYLGILVGLCLGLAYKVRRSVASHLWPRSTLQGRWSHTLDSSYATPVFTYTTDEHYIKSGDGGFSSSPYVEFLSPPLDRRVSGDVFNP
jgi:hypothetical protein